ncbi:hypothetical protein D0Y65_050999, partial [Glycine soja]
PKKISEALSLSLTQLSSSFLSSTIVAQQSSNLWSPFLLQIAKRRHFRSREAHLYVSDLKISEMKGRVNLGLKGESTVLTYEKVWAVQERKTNDQSEQRAISRLGRIDGDPALRGKRIWATWEYVSSVGEWYLEICRGGQETLGTSGGVLLPKIKLDQSRPNPGIIVMAAQLIHDRVEMECLEGAWETLEGNTRCRFRGTIRFTATSLVHPDEPVHTLQRIVEWILPTPTPYHLVEPVQVIEVTSSEEDPEEDLEELPPEPAVDALDFLEGDEDPLPEVDSPEDVMSASEADSTEDSGPGEMAISGGSSS